MRLSLRGFLVALLSSLLIAQPGLAEPVDSAAGAFALSPIYVIGSLVTNDPTSGKLAAAYEFAIHEAGPFDDFEGFKVTVFRTVPTYLVDEPGTRVRGYATTVEEVVSEDVQISITRWDEVQMWADLQVEMSLPITGSWNLRVTKGLESSPIVGFWGCNEGTGSYAVTHTGTERFIAEPPRGGSAAGTINGETVSRLVGCPTLFGRGDSAQFHFLTSSIQT